MNQTKTYRKSKAKRIKKLLVKFPSKTLSFGVYIYSCDMSNSTVHYEASMTKVNEWIIICECSKTIFAS